MTKPFEELPGYITDIIDLCNFYKIDYDINRGEKRLYYSLDTAENSPGKSGLDLKLSLIGRNYTWKVSGLAGICFENKE